MDHHPKYDVCDRQGDRSVRPGRFDPLADCGSRAAPQNCVAYVHLSTPNVDVLVDDVEYHVETLWETPIVCKRAPGTHMLRMRRSGRVLYEQEFTLGIGQEIVLVAWDSIRSRGLGSTRLL